ncbi:MAG TPA: YpdA family putative bacillithiol disulfide reductase [Caldithrix abyssi]|uniref:YpdA family putative bacillithiol disulfide reductase n=1 Tax=Caldithrix abyssi TaxID=187145 RepID=A0A7V1LJI9_CALAY|nr:YpdA family putative bacillithiol disulfide reductase [Caldithrix abyssi]
MKSIIQKEVLIIGAGPIGLACAIAAQKAGLDYIVIEKGVLVNSIFHFPTNMTFFSTSQLLEIGDVPFIAHGDKPTRREALEYYRRVAESWKLNIRLYEAVTAVSPAGTRGYHVETEKGIYKTNHIIVSTGFYDTPNLMGIPGEELPKVKHYYDEPHPYVGQKIVVVGGGNSAADVAIETYLKGAEVTMVIREDGFKESLKYWIRPNLENRINEGAIKAYFNSRLTEIREKEVDIRTPEGGITLENDFVLAMTGYKPDYPFLSKIGIKIGDDALKIPQHDPQTLETNLPGVYLAGVVNGGMHTGRWFIETARVHADIIIKHITGRG